MAYIYKVSIICFECLLYNGIESVEFDERMLVICCSFTFIYFLNHKIKKKKKKKLLCATTLLDAGAPRSRKAVLRDVREPASRKVVFFFFPFSYFGFLLHYLFHLWYPLM